MLSNGSFFGFNLSNYYFELLGLNPIHILPSNPQSKRPFGIEGYIRV